MLSRGPAKDGIVPTVSITVDDDVFADWILYKINADNVSSLNNSIFLPVSQSVFFKYTHFKFISFED